MNNPVTGADSIPTNLGIDHDADFGSADPAREFDHTAPPQARTMGTPARLADGRTPASTVVDLLVIGGCLNSVGLAERLSGCRELSVTRCTPAAGWSMEAFTQPEVVVVVGTDDVQASTGIIRRARELWPTACLIVARCPESSAELLELLAAGARTIVPPDTEPWDWSGVIGACLEGIESLPRPMLDTLLERAWPALFTDFESLGVNGPACGNVLRRVMMGWDRSSIARDLGISRSTVQSHLASLRRNRLVAAKLTELGIDSAEASPRPRTTRPANRPDRDTG